jgi:Spy/CpxP family protein refolding chaperone
MNRLVNVALVIGGLAVVAGSFAFAGTDPRSPPNRMSARIAKALDAIDATPEQRVAVQAASLDIQARLKASHQAGRSARGQIAELLVADQIDPDALRQVMNSRADQMKLLAAAIIPDLVKMHDALTPTQRQALYENWTARQELREQRQQQ